MDSRPSSSQGIPGNLDNASEDQLSLRGHPRAGPSPSTAQQFSSQPPLEQATHPGLISSPAPATSPPTSNLASATNPGEWARDTAMTPTPDIAGPSNYTLAASQRNQVPVEGEVDTIEMIAPPPYTEYPTERPSPPPKPGPLDLRLVDVNAVARGLPTVPLQATTGGRIASPPPEDTTPISPVGNPYDIVQPHNRLSSASLQTGNSTSRLLPGENGIVGIRGGGNGGGEVGRGGREREGEGEGAATAAAAAAATVNSGQVASKEKISEDNLGKSIANLRNKKVCGIVPLLWIVIGASVITILLSILLGVTLGIALRKQNNGNNNTPSNGDTNPPPPPDQFPSGPQSVKVQIFNQSQSCLDPATHLNTTDSVNHIMWSCNIPDLEFRWEFEPLPPGATINNLESIPSVLNANVSLPQDCGWMISSQEMKNQLKVNKTGVIVNDGVIEGTRQTDIGGGPMVRMVVIEGVQPPKFYRQPLLEVTDAKVVKRKAATNDTSPGNNGPPPPSQPKLYGFSMLYTKEIVLKHDTVNKLLANPTMPISGNMINVGDDVWRCTWEKTYFSAEVWLESNGPPPPPDHQPPLSSGKSKSAGIKRGGFSDNRMVSVTDYVSQGTSSSADVFKRHASPPGPPPGPPPDHSQSSPKKVRTRVQERRPTEAQLRQLLQLGDGDEVTKGEIICEHKRGGQDGSLVPPPLPLNGMEHRWPLHEQAEKVVEKLLRRGRMKRQVGSRELPSVCLCAWEPSED